MSQVKSLRVSGAMSFPHFIRHSQASFTTKEIDARDKKDFPIKETITVMESGTLDLIQLESNPVIIGDIVNCIYATYEVLDILETRLAKGDWESISVAQPQWRKVKVKFIN